MKALYFAIILVFVVLITGSSAFAQNVTNSTNSIPSNAIRTPNGGWITPLQTTNSSGGKLTIHYEVGTPVAGYANPGPPPDPIFLTDWRGNIDHFLTSHQVLLRADVYPEYDVKTKYVEINMTSDTGFAYDDKEHVTFEPNVNHMKQIIWQFIPTLAGNYTVEKFSDDIHTSTTYFSISDSKPVPNSPVLIPPLRQFKWGILPENIRCENNLVLFIRSEDNSPACVKNETMEKLVNRGWEIPVAIPSGIEPRGVVILVNTTNFSPEMTNISPIIVQTHDVRGTISWTFPNTLLQKIASSTTGIQISRGGGVDNYDHDSVLLELYESKTSDSHIIAATVTNVGKKTLHLYDINIQGRIAYTNNTDAIALQSTTEITPKDDAILGPGDSQTKYIAGNWTVKAKPVNVFSASIDYSYDDLLNYNGITNGYLMTVPVVRILR